MTVGARLVERLSALADRVPFDLALLPGADDGRLDAPPGGLPWPVPQPERELLARLGGFTLPPVEVRLTGHPRQDGDPRLPVHGWVVADDGGGGRTWVDVSRDGWGQVLMQYREGGLYVQAGSLAEWLDRLVTTAEELVDEVGFEDGVQPFADEFWDALHPDGPELPLVPAAEAPAGDHDPVLALLANRWPGGTLLADLRGAAPGSRARFDRVLGPYRLHRDRTEPVFAAVPWDWEHDRALGPAAPDPR